jgi:hypothetical protein
MPGETNLSTLLKNMTPILNPGNYVYCTTTDISHIDINETIASFKEAEGITIILKKQIADKYKLDYSYVAAWITLTVHSSLSATGLTAAFATALADVGISCNVVAAYYHDHIFVDKQDADKAINTLRNLSKQEG